MHKDKKRCTPNIPLEPKHSRTDDEEGEERRGRESGPRAQVGEPKRPREPHKPSNRAPQDPKTRGPKRASRGTTALGKPREQAKLEPREERKLQKTTRRKRKRKNDVENPQGAQPGSQPATGRLMGPQMRTRCLWGRGPPTAGGPCAERRSVWKNKRAPGPYFARTFARSSPSRLP